jgi:hypothetical protein
MLVAGAAGTVGAALGVLLPPPPPQAASVNVAAIASAVILDVWLFLILL